MAETVTLQPITEEMLAELWSISYGPKADLEWKKWDGPYFQDPVLTWEEFRTGFGASCIDNPLRKAISYQGRIVGIATAYWEDNTLQQWLEFGIAIYDASFGIKGLAAKQFASGSMSCLNHSLISSVSVIPRGRAITA